MIRGKRTVGEQGGAKDNTLKVLTRYSRLSLHPNYLKKNALCMK